MKWAIVQDEMVINLVEYDGEAEFDPGDDCTLEEVADEVQIGWYRENDNWINPNPPVVEAENGNE